MQTSAGLSFGGKFLLHDSRLLSRKMTTSPPPSSSSCCQLQYSCGDDDDHGADVDHGSTGDGTSIVTMKPIMAWLDDDVVVLGCDDDAKSEDAFASIKVSQSLGIHQRSREETAATAAEQARNNDSKDWPV